MKLTRRYYALAISVIAVCVLADLPMPIWGQDQKTISIKGRLTDDVSREGIPGVRVTLTGSGLKQPISALTGNDGQFLIAEAPQGAAFNLRYQKAGYFPGSLAERGAADKDYGDITMVRWRSISGVVSFRNGEPVPRAEIWALPVMGGKPAFSQIFSQRTLTDERGQFEISELRRLCFVLSVNVQSTSGIPEAESRPYVVRSMYYPESNAASCLSVKAFVERRGLKIEVDERPGVKISGKLEPSATVPAGAEALVGLAAPYLYSQEFALQRVKAGESFQFTGIPPGEYVLTASILDKQRQAFRRVVKPLVVESEPVSDLKVSFPSPVPIAGTVEFQKDPSQPPAPAAKVMLQFDSEKLPYMLSDIVASDANGDFLHWDTAPGEPMVMSIRQLPQHSFIAKVQQGERDLTSGRLDVTPGAGEVRILLKSGGGTVAGSVKQAQNPAKEAFVVLAPKRRECAHLYKTVTTGVDGSFRFEDLAPGDYDVFGFDRIDDYNYLDPAYLAKHSSKAVSVTIKGSDLVPASLSLIEVGGDR